MSQKRPLVIWEPRDFMSLREEKEEFWDVGGGDWLVAVLAGVNYKSF